METAKKKLHHEQAQEALYQPRIFRFSYQADFEEFNQLIASDSSISLYDEISGQLKELIKSLNPSKKIKEAEYPGLIEQHLDGRRLEAYGVWVYYPWSKRMVHLLDEEEFVEVRTNRNRYKITRAEQAALANRKIGIVGLSVGQSIALTLAMERTCGELRLADFDTAELSNLNRIRTGVHNLGVYKTVIAAREIAEIDPFLKIRLFNEGLTPDNIDLFFTGGGKLDLLVEVCDGLDIKIISRFKARELYIPVIMDTNDRGMLDIERFDLDPQRPIMHGLADGLDPANIRGLSNEDKIPYILKIVGADKISTRLKASMIEVEQSINTWPQLASSVVLGGAITTDVCRRILLDEFHDSGRYYIDIEDQVRDKEMPKKVMDTAAPENPYLPLGSEQMMLISGRYLEDKKKPYSDIGEENLRQIMEAALDAPSAGNNQPWKWMYRDGYLFLFHDKQKSWSWGDYHEMGAHVSLGAALENVHLQAASCGLRASINDFPLPDEPVLIAAVEFGSPDGTDSTDLALAKGIFDRHTNRIPAPRQKLPDEFLKHLQYFGREIGMEVFHTEAQEQLLELGEIIASCDRIRLLTKQGHEEFFHELRWTKEEALAERDGVDLSTAGLTAGELAGFRIAKDWNAIALLAGWDKGNAFKKNSLNAAKAASSFALFTMPDITHRHLIHAGRLIERFWIDTNQRGIAVHPMLSPVFFFNRLVHGRGAELSESVKHELIDLRERFIKIFPLEQTQKEVFLVKLSVVPYKPEKSLRKPMTDVFFKG